MSGLTFAPEALQCGAMSEPVTTVLGAALGLVTGALLALLASRQRLEVEYDIELRKHRIRAYQALWKILEPLAYYSPPSAVTYAVARDLSQGLRSWYFEVGGLFLSEESREAYFDLQKGLGGVIKEPVDVDHVPLGPQRFERLRAIASKLRTASTQDVATRVKPKHSAALLPRVVRRLRAPRAVEVTVRRGWLWGEDERECYSVLIQNPLSSPTVHVSHVYFETATRLSLLEKPIRLGPGGHWEIAVPVNSIPPASGDVRRLVKAELSDGTVVESRPGPDVEPHPDFLFAPERLGTTDADPG
jgi:hypothetical protein